VCDQQDGGCGDAVDDDDEEEDAEETALEGYETVLDKVDSPDQEFQMFRGTLLSKDCLYHSSHLISWQTRLLHSTRPSSPWL